MFGEINIPVSYTIKRNTLVKLIEELGHKFQLREC